MWQAVDKDSPIFWLKGGMKMEEHYLFEVLFKKDGKKSSHYIITSESDIVEEIKKIVPNSNDFITLNKLCKEEAIIGALWKESVVGMFADKVEQILLEYRASNCFELGRDEEEIKEIATYIFDEIMKEWKTNKTVSQCGGEVIKNPLAKHFIEEWLCLKCNRTTWDLGCKNMSEIKMERGLLTIDEEKSLYHLIWMLEQYCGYAESIDDPKSTRYNADAYAVMYLVENGYAETVGDKKFPETKFMDFVWTDKAKEILNAN